MTNYFLFSDNAFFIKMILLLEEKILNMKKGILHFTRKLLLPGIIIVSSSLHLSAQSFLDINNVKALVHGEGTLFWEIYGDRNSSFEVPKGSGKHTIFTSQLWLGGLDEGQQLHTAAQTYRQRNGSTNAEDFWPGPLNMDGSAVDPAGWGYVWKVNKSVIDYHLIHFNDPGYVIPQELLSWPGNGTGNVSHVLAPFVDQDGDQLYEPAEGDYPSIRGDQAVYFIINDNYGVHQHYVGGLPFKAEIHGMLYAFSSDNPMIDNTIFLNYRIINRSSNNYHDLYTAIWADFDIGNASDDYTGTDSARNMIFSYNGDSTDEDGADPGYGLHPPAQGIVFLNQSLSKSMYFTNQSLTGINSDPENSVELYRYLRGLWADGNPLTKGGTGRGGAQAANFMFDGNPCNSTGWIESEVPMSPGDRRAFGSSGPMTLAPGAILDIDVAYVYARDMNSVNSVCALQQAADGITNFYNYVITSVNSTAVKRLEMSPNPMSDYTTVKFSNPDKKEFTLKIMDVRGVTVRQIESITSNEIQIKKDELAAGTYLITLCSAKEVFHDKLLVK
jgi:hypothetical protein